MKSKTFKEEICEQQKDLAERRRLLQTEEVKLHAEPTWFKKRWRKRFGSRNSLGILTRLRHFISKECGVYDFMDHYGTAVIRTHNAQSEPVKVVAFVTEPYGPIRADIPAAVARVAKELGCEHHIDANSWWFPGETIRCAWYEGFHNTIPLEQIQRLKVPAWGGTKPILDSGY